MIRASLVLALTAWAPSALAAEYRAFTLTDGRTFVAEVLASEGTGMRIRLPPGESFVPYENLADMAPVDEAAFATQDDIYVYVVSDAPYRSGFQASYRGLPGVTLVGADPDPILSPEEQRAAALCGTDLACVVAAVDDNAHWMWVVLGQMDGTDATFESTVSKGGSRTLARAPRADVDAVTSAARAAIGLSTAATLIREPVPVVADPVRPPREPRSPRAPREMTADRAVALSFVPVPGLPSAAAGDWGGFGIGLATALPATAVWVGATGKTAQSPFGHVALGLGGYYAATVVTNQILSATRLRDDGLAVGVAPIRGEGAQITVTLAK